MKQKIIFLLFLITLVGFLTRAYLFGDAPAGLYDDEAGQGYSAYSILKTGQDEFGKNFPLAFRSFTDFKTPIYIYLIVPFIPIFDLSKTAVRFPSLLFSVLSFPLIYLLFTKITNKYAVSLALLTSFLVAISPWHVLFGRSNFEVVPALFLYLLGVYLFYLGLKKPAWLIASAVAFALSLPAYHSERILTPLTILILTIRFRKTLFSKGHLKFVVISAVLGLLITIPTIQILTTPGFLARANTLSFLSATDANIWGFATDYNGSFEWLLNSKPILLFRQFWSLYFSYLSPRYMFDLGDSGLRSSFPELATFYIWQLPFYLLGLILIWKEKNLGEIKFFTLMLLLLGPLPAAVTGDPYNTNRSLPLVIPQLTIIAFAMIKSYYYLSSRFHKLAIAGFMIIILHSLLNLWSSGIILNEYYRGDQWNYGWEEVVTTLKTIEPQLPAQIDSARGENYMQFAFFLKYDPIQFQKENYEVSLDEYYTNMQRKNIKTLGRYTFKAIDWHDAATEEKYLVGDLLVLSDPEVRAHNLTIIKDIKYPDGSVAFRIVKTNPK